MNTRRLDRTAGVLLDMAGSASAAAVLSVQAHASGRVPAAIVGGSLVAVWLAFAVAYSVAADAPRRRGDT